MTKPTVDELRLLHLRHLLNGMLARRASFERIAQVKVWIAELAEKTKLG